MKLFFLLGSLGMCSGVMLGAFAAHGLKGRISAESLAVFQTGVQYQFLHSLGLLFLGMAAQNGWTDPFLRYAGVSFFIGMFLFCGSLYGLANGGPRWLGPITPLGGTLFLIGWALVIWSAWRL